jgi:cyclophilin family peptidyl-prolyl cis-trans isomerase
MKTGSKIVAGLCFWLAGLLCGCGSHNQGAPPTASINGGEAAPSPNSDAAPQPAGDRWHPVVEIHTSLGEIRVKLDRENAPITVDNFLAYVEKGQYDNTLVHQVLEKPGVIVAGGYDAFRKERPTGPPIRNEAHNGLKNARLTLAMARRSDSIDSSTSQFFINSAANAELDHTGDDAKSYGYCVFGTVTGGADVVDQIAITPVHDAGGLTSTPVEPVVIKWVHIVQ